MSATKEKTLLIKQETTHPMDDTHEYVERDL